MKKKLIRENVFLSRFVLMLVDTLPSGYGDRLRETSWYDLHRKKVVKWHIAKAERLDSRINALKTALCKLAIKERQLALHKRYMYSDDREVPIHH